MPRFVAFLRGVSPLNARMPELRQCFEAAGFERVRTVLGSGNVVFDAAGDSAALQGRAEQAMQQGLGRSFMAFVRSTAQLERLLATDPYRDNGIPAHAKRVVTFLHEGASPRLTLPLAQDFASVFAVQGSEAFSAYVPSPSGPVFMKLIEQAFGRDVTTRTWDTLRKCVQ